MSNLRRMAGTRPGLRIRGCWSGSSSSTTRTGILSRSGVVITTGWGSFELQLVTVRHVGRSWAIRWMCRWWCWTAECPAPARRPRRAACHAYRRLGRRLAGRSGRHLPSTPTTASSTSSPSADHPGLRLVTRSLPTGRFPAPKREAILGGGECVAKRPAGHPDEPVGCADHSVISTRARAV